MPRRLYHCPEARSMRSLWLLNELGLDFELVELGFDMKSLRSPEYLAIHPLGRVPCLVDGERVVFESGAICQYLCETYDDGTLHRAAGHQERTEWLQWVHYAETIAGHGASLVQQRVFIAPNERSEAVRNLESRRLGKAVGVIDDHLTDREYLLASGFTAADIGVGYSLHLAGKFIPLDSYSRVVAYYERLRARPAFQASLGKGA